MIYCGVSVSTYIGTHNAQTKNSIDNKTATFLCLCPHAHHQRVQTARAYVGIGQRTLLDYVG